MAFQSCEWPSIVGFRITTKPAALSASTSSPVQWTATRYRARMETGDIVFLWRGGDAPIRGVYGWGQISGTPYGVPVVEACKLLEAGGADVVGLNCRRGPKTLMPIVKKVREAVSCHVAAVPVPYRTTEAEPTFRH